MAYIRFSSDQCILNGATYQRVPVVLARNHRPVHSINTHLRYRIRSRNSLPSTAIAKGYILTNFCSFLESDELVIAAKEKRRAVRDLPYLLHSIDDAVLERWRNRDELAGLHPRVINSKISTVLQFLWWARKIDDMPHRIGEEPGSPVLVWREKRQYKTVLCSELLFKGGRLFRKPKGVPNAHEMDNAYVRASDTREDLAIRDNLIIRTAEECGLRCAEILGLRAEQVPSLDEIESAEQNETQLCISVMGKGQKERDTPFPTGLLREILAYVNITRASVMASPRCTAAHTRIFVSHKNGTPLNEQYISRRLSDCFRDAAAERRLSLQRVRARFANETIRTLVDEEIARSGSIKDIREENILNITAELMGQSNKRSLRDYLETELKARVSHQMRKLHRKS
ncbi:tyrosine-type recombinase/integrase [Paraburkholderia sp. BL25I1N1]|uniref:tyrosine-type recombinase/integrase n=1 Tax=Paraburkholderia sp. BL25I1N1 TaxID=1938804 RepID=UPI000D475EE5|nr:tyrosine-type recombinase/integrase [Paraburkholderia sp. BL25I1N1]PRY04695.1 site-specific recombinase XerD [Paraburkholderia sp. BL25I1N1]